VTTQRLRLEAASWFGVFASPFAWTVQHVVGFAMATAACPTRHAERPLAVNTVTIAVTVPCMLIAVAGIVAAFWTYRNTGDSGEYDAPPGGRFRFMAMIGLTVSPLFIFIMFLSGFGVLDFPECRQS
jgi:hypothetical protein